MSYVRYIFRLKQNHAIGKMGFIGTIPIVRTFITLRMSKYKE